MRPLPQIVTETFDRKRFAFLALITVTAGAWMLGCGGGGAFAPPPPPPSITVSVTPSSGSVVLGNQLTLTATVTNASDTTVSWSVNGIAGGNSTVGTISSAGIDIAPADLPPSAAVQITATSHADTTKSGSASITITSDLTLSLTPNPASVELGATQRFQATMTSSGHPDTTVRWSLSGAAGPSACGMVDSQRNLHRAGNSTFTHACIVHGREYQLHHANQARPVNKPLWWPTFRSVLFDDDLVWEQMPRA